MIIDHLMLSIFGYESSFLIIPSDGNAQYELIVAFRLLKFTVELIPSSDF